MVGEKEDLYKQQSNQHAYIDLISEIHSVTSLQSITQRKWCEHTMTLKPVALTIEVDKDTEARSNSLKWPTNMRDIICRLN